MCMFVTPQGFAGDAVDAGQVVDPTPGQHRVHGRGRHVRPAADLHGPQPVTPPHANHPAHHLGPGPGRTHVRSRAAVGHPGRTLGRKRARLNRARGVKAAFAWDTKASWLVKRFLDSSTSQPEAFPVTRAHRYRTGQPPWRSHLAAPVAIAPMPDRHHAAISNRCLDLYWVVGYRFGRVLVRVSRDANFTIVIFKKWKSHVVMNSKRGKCAPCPD
jgi:hypothetical protein